MRTLLGAMLVLACGWIHAQDLKPFDASSPRAIAAANSGKPYVLVLWSLYCDPCRDEMPQWGELQRKFPAVPIILVATDGSTESALVRKFLAQHRLGPIETWNFADEFVERVRHAVDPAWRGELPRTYLFDRAHRAKAVSGKVSSKDLSQWLASQR